VGQALVPPTSDTGGRMEGRALHRCAAYLRMSHCCAREPRTCALVRVWLFGAVAVVMAADVLFGSLASAVRQAHPATVNAGGGVLRARLVRQRVVANDFDTVSVRCERHRTRWR
jgi:hypothetical protein